MEKEIDYKAVPLYRHSAEYAIEHDELALYRESHRANKACSAEIEKTIYENYKDNRLDTKNNSVQLGQNFTMERVAYVLANTIQIKSHDGRISDANKAWAASVQVAEDKSEWGDNRNLGFLVDRVNPGLLDLLANQVRAMMVGEKGKDEKRISIQGILHKSTSKQLLEKKHHERSHEDVL